MALEELRARIERQRAEMRNGEYLRDLVDEERTLLLQDTPVGTGNLVRNLTTLTPLRESAQGFTAGLGDKRRVGYDSRQPMSRTITAFLRDFPQFRTRAGGEVKAGDKQRAWWDLPLEGKQELQRQREQGRYGGSPGGIGSDMASYLYPQEGSFSGWSSAARKAGIHPTHFVADSLDEWRSQAVAKVLARLGNKMGWR